MIHIEPNTTTNVLRIELYVISRLNSVVECSPLISDFNEARATTNVFTLIPPAVDCEPPPIHISTKYRMIATLEKSLSATLLKPAVRGATALNRDCTIFYEVRAVALVAVSLNALAYADLEVFLVEVVESVVGFEL